MLHVQSNLYIYILERLVKFMLYIYEYKRTYMFVNCPHTILYIPIKLFIFIHICILVTLLTIFEY